MIPADVLLKKKEEKRKAGEEQQRGNEANALAQSQKEAFRSSLLHDIDYLEI
jgi:hypothetical protein